MKNIQVICHEEYSCSFFSPARQLVQKELAVMKDEINNSRWVVAGPSAARLAQEWDWDLVHSSGRRHMLLVGMKSSFRERWSSKVVGMKSSFRERWSSKVGLPGYTKSSIQGITDDEVLIRERHLERMVPRQAHKWIDWDQTRKE